MDRPEAIRFAGVQLALVAAGLHLVWGAPRLVVYLNLGRLPDLRPPLFVLSALAVVAAVGVLYLRGHERPVYALLVSVMLAYLVGYAAWHLAGHPLLDEGGFRTHLHPDDPVTIIVSHLANDGFALAATVCEVGAVAALAPALIGGE